MADDVKPTTCRSCGAPIIWCRTQKRGALMPVDPEPVADGNLVIEERTVEALTGLMLEAARAEGQPLWLSHFVTCPNADQHRK